MQSNEKREKKEINRKVMKEILNNLKCTRIYEQNYLKEKRGKKIMPRNNGCTFSKFREKKITLHKLSKEHRHREVYTQTSE